MMGKKYISYFKNKKINKFLLIKILDNFILYKCLYLWKITSYYKKIILQKFLYIINWKNNKW